MRLPLISSPEKLCTHVSKAESDLPTICEGVRALCKAYCCYFEKSNVFLSDDKHLTSEYVSRVIKLVS